MTTRMPGARPTLRPNQPCSDERDTQTPQHAKPVKGAGTLNAGLDENKTETHDGGITKSGGVRLYAVNRCFANTGVRVFVLTKKLSAVTGFPFSRAHASNLSWWRVGIMPPVPPNSLGCVHAQTFFLFTPAMSATA